MLMNHETSVLLIIDVQSSLAPVIQNSDHVIENCIWLAGVARKMGVPIIVTEHFPDKIGHTVDALKTAAPDARYVSKTFFSAQSGGCLRATEVSLRSQVIICGTEAHVCVQQTALDLRWIGKEVFVVAEAVGSRADFDRDLALQRMRDNGIEVVSREMVAFEWLQRGGTEMFREVHGEFIR